MNGEQHDISTLEQMIFTEPVAAAPKVVAALIEAYEFQAAVLDAQHCVRELIGKAGVASPLGQAFSVALERLHEMDGHQTIKRDALHLLVAHFSEPNLIIDAVQEAETRAGR